MNEWMCIVYLLMALFFFWKGKKGNRQKSHQKAEIKDSQNSNMFLLKENLWSISIWVSFFPQKSLQLWLQIQTLLSFKGRLESFKLIAKEALESFHLNYHTIIDSNGISN
jgi:hypothetical protein